jgi:hypothetical protein
MRRNIDWIVMGVSALGCAACSSLHATNQTIEQKLCANSSSLCPDGHLAVKRSGSSLTLGSNVQVVYPILNLHEFRCSADGTTIAVKARVRNDGVSLPNASADIHIDTGDGRGTPIFSVAFTIHDDFGHQQTLSKDIDSGHVIRGGGVDDLQFEVLFGDLPDPFATNNIIRIEVQVDPVGVLNVSGAGVDRDNFSLSWPMPNTLPNLNPQNPNCSTFR